MSHDGIADHVDVDADVLVHQDVTEPSNLGPRDLRARAGDLIGKMVHGVADDLQVPLDRILCHLRDVTLTVQRSDVLLAPLDCL